jgi:hypothetical protein
MTGKFWFIDVLLLSSYSSYNPLSSQHSINYTHCVKIDFLLANKKVLNNILSNWKEETNEVNKGRGIIFQRQPLRSH